MACSLHAMEARGSWKQVQEGVDPAEALQSVVPHSLERQREIERALLANAPGCCHSGCELPLKHIHAPVKETPCPAHLSFVA